MSRSLVFHSRSSFDISLFLAPAFAHTRIITRTTSSTREFSSSQAICEGYKAKREKNKNRGVSALRSTGPRVPYKINKYPLPEPAKDAQKRRAEFMTNPDHGLWGFFNDSKAPMVGADEEGAYGRHWTYQELTRKSFDDLHKLWWICIRERNQTLTRLREMQRIRAGYGEVEAETRAETIVKTMKEIKSVLRDRQLNYDEAQSLIARKPLPALVAVESNFDDWRDAEDASSGSLPSKVQSSTERGESQYMTALPP